MNIKSILKSLFFVSTIGLFTACGGGDNSVTKSKRAGINEVVVHMSADPDRLNQITATSGVATEVQNYIFEALITTNSETLEFEPFLAKALGVMEEVTFQFDGEEKNGLTYAYEIRDEANWNDGTPITGHDLAFYLKAMKNPKVDNENVRPYFEAIVDVEVDAENPKKVKVWFQDKYFLAESLSGIIALQKSVYDPEGFMEKFTVRELAVSDASTKFANDENINKFATMFNSEKYSREIVEGSGPYVFKSWVTGERIILEKNPNWWAKDLVGKEYGFYNHPDKITFEIIVDVTTATTAQKDEAIDVMKHTSKDYVDLKENEIFLDKYKFETPIAPQYSYIGLNTKSQKLSDKRVRKALSMALDYDTYKEIYLYGLAERTVSPIHPLKDYYNKNITPYPFDLEAASALLTEAGWVDNDGDGIREMEIEGADVPLSLEFKYSSGSKAAEDMALMFKKSLSQIGVNLEIAQKEWTVFLEDVKSHNFDMVTMAWVMGSGLSDMKQIWHTESYNGGSNYVGFGNAETDAIIDAIRYENDEAKRNVMYAEIQEIIHEEAPYIFLFTGKSKIAFHNRFDNAKGYNVRPGYNAAAMMLNKSWGAEPVAE